MGFLENNIKYNQLLEIKKQELISLNVNKNDLNFFIITGKNFIEKYGKEERIVNNKIGSLKSLIIKLQELRKLGYEDGDIDYLIKKGLDYMEVINNSVISPDQFDRAFLTELRNPEVAKQNILIDRLSPEEYLERTLQDLQSLGYTNEDINVFRKRGLALIEKNKDSKASFINRRLKDEFLLEKQKAEVYKKQMSESRVGPVEYLKRELQELQRLGYPNEDLNKFKTRGLAIIERNKNASIDIIKNLIRSEFIYEKTHSEEYKKHLAESRVTPKECLIRELQELQRLGYTNEDILELRKRCLALIEKNKTASQEQIKNLIKREFSYEKAHPAECQKQMAESRVTPLECLQRELQELQRLGYSNEDLNTLKTRGLALIEKNKTTSPDIIKRLIKSEFSYEKSNVEKCKRQMAEDRVTYDERKTELLKELEKAGYGELKIREIKEKIDATIKKLKSEGLSDSLIKKNIESELKSYISLINKEIKDKERQLDIILNKAPNKAYSNIYGEKHAKSQNQAEALYEKTKFFIAHGHNSFDELERNIMIYLKLLGYGISEISEVSQKLRANSKSDYMTRLSEANRTVSDLVNENRSYIELFEKYKHALVLPANVYYGNESTENVTKFIKEFLTKNSKEKQDFIELMNKKLKDYYIKNNKEKTEYEFLLEFAMSEEEKEMLKKIYNDISFNNMFSSLITNMRIIERNEDLYSMFEDNNNKNNPYTSNNKK